MGGGSLGAGMANHEVHVYEKTAVLQLPSFQH